MEKVPAVSVEDLTSYKELLRDVKPDASEVVLAAAARMLAVSEVKTGQAPTQIEAQDALDKAEQAHADAEPMTPKIIADGMVVGDAESVNTEELRRAA